MRTSSKTWTGQVGRYISGLVIYGDCWYVPYDSSSVRVQCWGPGGNGGHTDYDSHGGGGGGEYRENTVSVSPGNKFYIGIVYDPTAGVPNGLSSVQGNLVGTLAFGGGNPGNSGRGMGGSGGYGAIGYNGGNGSQTSGAGSGAGGGGAGSTGAGGHAVGIVCGLGHTDGGGNGGNGSYLFQGNNGLDAGGGGAGCWNVDVIGGTGGTGRITITWSISDSVETNEVLNIITNFD